MAPFISIVVPVYNTEKFLPECLDSLLNQTLKEIEIIIVNDASPQNCPAIVAQYQKKDSRISLLNLPENRGTLSARIEGFKIAKGKYIQSVDSDDSLLPNACEIIYHQLEHQQADICHISAHIYLDPDKNQRAVQDPLTAKMFAPKQFLLCGTKWAQLLTQPAIDNCLCFYIVKKELIQQMINLLEPKIQNQKILMLEDFLQVFTLSSLLEGKIISLHQQLYQYRLGCGITSREKTFSELQEQIDNILSIFHIVFPLLQQSANYNPQSLQNFKERLLYDIGGFLTAFQKLAPSKKESILSLLESKYLLKDFTFLLSQLFEKQMPQLSSDEKKMLKLYRFLFPDKSIRKKVLKALFFPFKKIMFLFKGKY